MNQSELLEKTFALCFNFVQEKTTPETAAQLAKQSYETIENYFHNLKIFQIIEDGQIKTGNKKITEKEILAFSVWMQQFLKDLKVLMIGIGKIELPEITAEIREPLEKMGFYEFYEQATELSY